MTKIKFTRRKLLETAGIALSAPMATAKTFLAKEIPSLVDIVIVGSGAAGISAAIAAKEAGASQILVLEQLPFFGGSTRLSAGYFNAVDPERQKSQGIVDSIEKHIEHTQISGRYRGEKKLIEALCSGALDTLHWLESLGVSYEKQCVQTYGGLFPRAHVPLVPEGSEHYIDTLIRHAQKLGIQLIPKCRMSDILFSDGRVKGVEVDLEEVGKLKIEVRKGVILGTGGFSANKELRSVFDPRLKNLKTTNLPGSTGEALLAAQKIGAFLTGMDFIECIPLDVRYSRFAILVEHCIFVDQQGRRFIREDGLRDVLRDQFLSIPEHKGYVIVDQDGYEKCPVMFKKEVPESLRQKEIFTANSLEDLARQLRLPVANFQETIKRYNAFVDARQDLDFKRDPRSMLYKISKPPFWASKAEMSVHHTMGGIRINPSAQALDWDGKPIKGLYAAGEVAGGIHGANRLGGNAITDAHFFGRTAGTNLAKEFS